METNVTEVARIEITLSNDGQLNVRRAGVALENKIIALGMLSIAEEVFKMPPAAAGQAPPRNRLLMPNGPLPPIRGN
jgi:hypothetical protein